MGVEAVLLDLDGTLLLPSGEAVPGVPEMMQELREADISIAVASNRPGSESRLSAAGLSCDLFLHKGIVGANKGSPKWITKACDHFGVAPNQIIALGDSDPDMWSAANARVVYFHALWSTDWSYGLPIKSPALFSLFVRECFAKDLNWYSRLETTDRRGRGVRVFAMLDGRSPLRSDLLGFLKYHGNPKVGPIGSKGFVMAHLLASVYGDGLSAEPDLWSIYPGSSGGPNRIMGPYIETGAKLFKDLFLSDLLVRHTPALDSGTARYAGGTPTFWNQINTVHVNPSYRDKIAGKCVLLIDDFTTDGYSLECARNLLLEAGASDVVAAVIGRYRTRQSVYTPVDGYAWDPFVPTSHDPSSFLKDVAAGTNDDDAREALIESYSRVAALPS